MDNKTIDDLSVCPHLEPMTRERLEKLRDDRDKAVVRSRKKRDLSNDGSGSDNSEDYYS